MTPNPSPSPAESRPGRGEAFRGRSVLVTGATGFVGSALVASLLGDGAEVTLFIRDWEPSSELIRSGGTARCTVVQGELESISSIQRAIVSQDAEVVMHLGAESLVRRASRDPLGTFESNIRGTYNLLEACRCHSVSRVVIASSDKAYGVSERLPYVETDALRGRFPYDVSKSCADLIAQSYHFSFGLNVAIARCGNIYGPGDTNWDNLIPGTIRHLLRNEAPLVRSDGSPRRDYLYIDDAVAAYRSLALAAGDPDVAGNAFNFGPATSSTVLEVVTTLRELTAKQHVEPRIAGRTPHEIVDQHLDSSKAERVLGWRPRVGLRDGLERTVPWYAARLG